MTIPNSWVASLLFLSMLPNLQNGTNAVPHLVLCASVPLPCVGLLRVMIVACCQSNLIGPNRVCSLSHFFMDALTAGSDSANAPLQFASCTESCADIRSPLLQKGLHCSTVLMITCQWPLHLSLQLW